MPKVSVIIPVYKAEKYIIRCLDSVINQTYKGEMECILIDDCSPDNSLAMCEDYVNKYKGNINFTIIHLPLNGGQSVARNVGIKEATGDYLYCLDSDDEIPENAIQLLTDEVVKHPGIDVVMGTMIDDRHSQYYNLDCYREHQFVTRNSWLQYNLFKSGKTLPVNPVNKLLRKGFIEKNNLYFKPGIIHEDEHWMFYLVKYLKSWAFVFVPTYIRYWNEGTTMTFKAKQKTLEAQNWYKILFDWSDNLYEPFIKLQLCKLVYLFYFRKVYKYTEESHILFSKFLSLSNNHKFFLLTLTLLSCKICTLGGAGYKFIYLLSSLPYRIESMKIKRILHL